VAVLWLCCGCVVVVLWLCCGCVVVVLCLWLCFLCLCCFCLFCSVPKLVHLKKIYRGGARDAASIYIYIYIYRERERERLFIMYIYNITLLVVCQSFLPSFLPSFRHRYRFWNHKSKHSHHAVLFSAPQCLIISIRVGFVYIAA
jgi:hypothetical protein